MGNAPRVCILATGMGEVDNRLVGRFLGETGLKLPLSAEDALMAARLWPVPCRGPARLENAELHYDERRPGWEREVWLLVCGELLRREGRADDADACVRLARAFGAVGPSRAMERGAPRRSARQA